MFDITRWKTRLIVLKVQGKKELISFLTSDFDSSVVEVIERYSRLLRIENQFTEQLHSNFLDNLPLLDYLKNYAVDAIRIITSDVMKLFMNDVGVDYFRMFPETFYREAIKDLFAEIGIDGDRVIVKFDYFDEVYLLVPLFRDMNQKIEKIVIDPCAPWLGNRKLDIQFADSV